MLTAVAILLKANNSVVSDFNIVRLRTDVDLPTLRRMLVIYNKMKKCFIWLVKIHENSKFLMEKEVKNFRQSILKNFLKNHWKISKEIYDFSVEFSINFSKFPRYSLEKLIESWNSCQQGLVFWNVKEILISSENETLCIVFSRKCNFY